MKIETKTITKEITETENVFRAFDGTEFSSARKCADYELKNHYFPNKAEWCKVNSVEEFTDLVRLWAIDRDDLSYGVKLDDKRIDEVMRDDRNLALFDKIGDSEIVKLTFPKLEDSMFPMIIQRELIEDDGYRSLPIYKIITTTYAKKLAQEEIDALLIEVNNLSDIEHELLGEE